MAAHDDATVTIDTNEMVYPDKNGMTYHTVTNGQTFILDLAAGEDYKMLVGKTITCTDGTTLTIDGDPAFTSFTVTADATEEKEVGAIRIWEDWNKTFTDWNISAATIDNVDEPTALSMTLNAKDGTKRTFSLTTVTVAQ
jgi:hypothetical protein